MICLYQSSSLFIIVATTFVCRYFLVVPLSLLMLIVSITIEQNYEKVFLEHLGFPQFEHCCLIICFPFFGFIVFLFGDFGTKVGTKERILIQFSTSDDFLYISKTKMQQERDENSVTKLECSGLLFVATHTCYMLDVV